MDENRKEAFDRASQLADLCMWKLGTPGMVLGVTDRKKTMFASAKGLADVAARRPMETDLLFQIGSISKSFTCIALLQLAEEGTIDLDAPVTKYLPWFSVKSKYSAITLHHLMTHTAGIVIGADSTPTGWTEVWDLRDTETSCEPGTHYHYSNSGYKALGLVLETVTGRCYGDIIRERVLQGAGMRTTEPVITNDIRGSLAVGHVPTHDDRPCHARSSHSPATWFEGDTGDGSICAPLEDMLAYIRVLLNRGEGPFGRILSADGFRRMTTPHAKPDDEVHWSGYGYALNVEKVDGHTYLGHSGGMVGYYTSMIMDMESGIGAMAMVNGLGYPDEVARFMLEAMRAALDGRALPDVPSKDEAFASKNATDYVGEYSGPDGSIEVKEKDGTLRLRSGGTETVLEPREGDAFFAHASGFEMFLTEFERNDDGRVVRVYNGSHTYVRGEDAAGTVEPAKAGGLRFEGHYRSHNPWLSNFRVVERMGGLALVLPNDRSLPLVQLGDRVFRIGPDPNCPERVEFGCIIDGVATSATLSGGGRMGRTFTP